MKSTKFARNTSDLIYSPGLSYEQIEGKSMPITVSGYEGLAWRKASSSAGNGECIEVAAASGKRIFIRDSKDPGGPILSCSADTFQSFLYATKSGNLPS
jgi:Domain of unknown function (DUF397)